jgi:hypothetical protein
LSVSLARMKKQSFTPLTQSQKAHGLALELLATEFQHHSEADQIFSDLSTDAFRIKTMSRIFWPDFYPIG